MPRPHCTDALRCAPWPGSHGDEGTEHVPFGESCSSEGTLASAGRAVLAPAAETPAAGPVPAPAASPAPADDDAAVPAA